MFENCEKVSVCFCLPSLRIFSVFLWEQHFYSGFRGHFKQHILKGGHFGWLVSGPTLDKKVILVQNSTVHLLAFLDIYPPPPHVWCKFWHLKTKEKLVQNLTVQMAKIGPQSILTTHISIQHIWCRVKSWSKICLFKSQNLSKFSVFLLFCLLKTFLFLEDEWDFSNKGPKCLKFIIFMGQKLIQWIMLRNILGSVFDLSLDQILTVKFRQCVVICGCFVAFSARICLCQARSKRIRSTICEHNCANRKKTSWGVFLHFWFWVFFAVSGCFLTCFLVEKKTKAQKNKQKRSRQQDPNKKQSRLCF